MAFAMRLFICIFALGLCLYSYIDKQNELTRLHIRLPALDKEIRSLKEENMQLQYAIDQFESPRMLMELARNCEYSHLKYPLMTQVMTVGEGLALSLPQDKESVLSQPKTRVTFAAVSE
jgi:hypothetical protein